jgi:predicted nucleic-acid-binding protein
MIAVETNLLVRILADDPGQPAQVKAARALASQAQQVFLPLVVQVETVWVLESGYKFTKEVIILALEHLEVNQAFVQEDEDLSHRARGLFRVFNVDYSDCVILSICHSRNFELYTFDKRLGKLGGASPAPTHN